MIRLKLFGLLKTLANNQTDISVPLDGGKKLEDLVGLLDKEYPAMAELVHKKKVLISVNQEIAHPETLIQEGDEVALLPPFAGGMGEFDEEMFVRVQQGDFSIDAEIARVRARSTRIGGSQFFSARRGIAPKAEK